MLHALGFDLPGAVDASGGRARLLRRRVRSGIKLLWLNVESLVLRTEQ